MDVKDILGKVDHTLLDVTATWDDIKNLCDDAMKYQTAVFASQVLMLEKLQTM